MLYVFFRRCRIADELFRTSERGWFFAPIRFVGPLSQFESRPKQKHWTFWFWLKTKPRKKGVDLRGIEVERWYWPAKVMDALLETFLIPHKPACAEPLFDVELAEQTSLFRARHPELLWASNATDDGGRRSPLEIHRECSQTRLS